MKTIVVLGAGYAGLKTVIALQKKLHKEVKIILVDQNPYHYETMRLYEVASGSYPYTRMSYQLSDVLDKDMTELIVDRVEKINIKEKNVELKNHAPLSYDIYAEMKAYREDKDKKHLSIVICGAGFQAIELAGALAEARPRFAKMAGADAKDITIKMLDGSPVLLPMFQGKLLDYALGLVKKNSIEIINPAFVQGVSDHSVSYKMKDSDEIKEIPAGTRIWMMGFSGSPVIEASGFKNRRGRVMVSDHLTAPESDDIYLLGDVSSVMVPGKKWPWPNTAQMALSMANYAAKDIRSRINGQARPSKYVYHDLGVVVAVGETKAAGKAMGHGYKGYMASALKKIIIDKSLMETGGLKETLSVGRFDLYH